MRGSHLGNEDAANGALDAADRRKLDRMAWLLDESIPLLGGFRIGLDSVVGLIPGLGDGVGLAISSYILMQANRAGVPRAVLGRMVLNVLIEAFIGVVPVLGDLFDMVWKSNRRNVTLLQEHLATPEQAKRSSLGFLAGMLLLITAIVVGLISVTVMVISSILKMF